MRPSVSRILRSRFKIPQKFPQRSPMNGKRGNKNFYKGYGAPTYGFHTTTGKFIVQYHKVPPVSDFHSHRIENKFYVDIPDVPEEKSFLDKTKDYVKGRLNFYKRLIFRK
ncbi:hypothetical protein RF11_15144 [Thelohanellus kitauei]|uniref:39S ribosomal protein L41, mitochondrial n=1 Tax=Thelohanellus kitauei TaxID=669202 RepID=A0A0C2NA78_THEKT|nr:hypothetical protein RF11_15144 [Thelohanellus kitauei]